MEVLQIVGLIMLPFVWWLMADLNKQHRETTGISMPSRKAMKNIRRNARRRGISVDQAHAEWVHRNGGHMGLQPSKHIAPPVDVPPPQQGPPVPPKVRARQIAEDFCRPYALRVTSGGEDIDTMQRDAHLYFVEHQDRLVSDYFMRQMVHECVWTGVRDLVAKSDGKGDLS